MSWICEKCAGANDGERSPGWVFFCEKCGERLPWTCGSCGSEKNEPLRAICRGCGERPRYRRRRPFISSRKAWNKEEGAAYDFIACDVCDGFLFAHKADFGNCYPGAPRRYEWMAPFPEPSSDEISEWRAFITEIYGWEPVGGECPDCGGCLEPSEDDALLHCAVETEDDEKQLARIVARELDPTLGEEPFDDETYTQCRHCRARVLRPPVLRQSKKRGSLVSRPKRQEELKSDVLLEMLLDAVGKLAPPVTLKRLKTHFKATSLSGAVTQKRLRAGIERAIREGLMKVYFGEDGAVLYCLVDPSSKAPPPNEGSGAPGNNSPSSS